MTPNQLQNPVGGHTSTSAQPFLVRAEDDGQPL
jgi:hypothetical protein